MSSADVPAQHGRTAVVTGANSGIGLEAAARLAHAGARTVLACRSTARADTARREILGRHPDAQVEILFLDLADLHQVASAAAEAADRFGEIHMCVNNAGILVRSRSITVDGLETTLGVNHLGHFAWTAHLLPTILAAADSRIVTVSSLAHIKTSLAWDDLQGERSFRPTVAYRRSKLANLLFTLELQRRLAASDEPGARDTVAVAAHPGIAASSFWGNAAGPRASWIARVVTPCISVVFNTAAQGAQPLVHAATDPAITPGACYGPSILQRWGKTGEVTPSKAALDPSAASRLWTISEELSGVTMNI